MLTPILATKLYMPPPRPKAVLRPNLIERLNEGLLQNQGFRRKLTLISAPAGFGKTILVSEWAAGSKRPVAWLSLDEGDNDPACFLTYLVAALQTVAPKIGEGILGILRAAQSQPPAIELLLTNLLNELTTLSHNFMLVLDDYHVIDSKPVDEALTFLIEHLPPQVHLVIATREDPHLPLARLRARGQLTELRAADLRFTSAEAAEFLNRVMGLNLSAEDIAALENRTEGWIAGLQLAAMSMQGREDTAGFIRSFTGSHHFILDYLVEEVLQRQPETVQNFLLRTSILDRLCGTLCDAVLLDPSAFGQETLEYLEHANLFIVPLDNERHWYRYHHLFAELLRQRLHQSTFSSGGDEGRSVAELHSRASLWYEGNDLGVEAFQHAAAAKDFERAEHLIDTKGLQMNLLGAAAVLDWLKSLPTTVLDARPSLWVRYASTLLVVGQITGVEKKLRAAEAALQSAEEDDKTRDLIGQIAAARAMVALCQYQIDIIIPQSRRALEYLHPDNLFSRFRANLTVASAYQFKGERAAAARAYAEVLSISQKSGNVLHTSVATIGLGQIQESENQLYLAAETYRRAFKILGDRQAPPVTSEGYLGLAHILYEWNDLDAAEEQGQLGLQLAQQYDKKIDIFVMCELFLARLKLARGDLAGADAILAEVEQFVRENNFVYRLPEVAAAQALTKIRQGDLTGASQLAQMHKLPLSQARVLLAKGDPPAALAVLEPFCREMEAKGWADELLKVLVLQAIALHANGQKDKAAKQLEEAFALAQPEGFVRTFVDEGRPMAQLLSEAADLEIMPEYTAKLLSAFQGEELNKEHKKDAPPARRPGESLSARELEVLQLIAQGLSNREISERLFLSLVTVKGHNRNIFDKLQVQRRTEAVARARELGLLKL